MLDSVVSPDPDRLAMVRARAMAFEDGLQRFAAWCAADATCPLSAGATVDAGEILAIVDELVTRLDAAPIPGGGGETASENELMSAITTAIGSGRMAWTSLAASLADARDDDGAALVAATTSSGLALEDGSTWFGSEASLAIQALDLPFTTDVTRESYEAFVEGDLAVVAPRMGRAIGAESRSLVQWPIHRPLAARTIGAPAAPPALLLAGMHDPATPFAGAQELLDALGNGSYLVAHEGDGHVQIAQSSCIREVAVAFLVDPTAPPDRTTCPAD